MDELELDIIRTPAKLVVTKNSLEIIQTEKGPHQFEIYQLVGDVIGFELFRLSASPVSSPISSGGATALLLVGGLFGTVAYSARTTGWSNVDFVLPTFISFFCFVAVANGVLFPKVQPGIDYALRIRLAAEPDKLLPCASSREVRSAISQIYTFIHSGAYLSHVIVRNQLYQMVTQVVRHTPAE